MRVCEWGGCQWASYTRGRCDVIWEISHVNRNRTHASKCRCLNKENKILYTYAYIYIWYIHIHMYLTSICVQLFVFRLLTAANKINGGRSVCRDCSISKYWRARNSNNLSNNNTYTTTTVHYHSHCQCDWYLSATTTVWASAAVWLRLCCHHHEKN